ncbi:MAG TPA: zf-HC2 domain-containing protein [Blastocatellia bacterium]|nr:zf-HC2 domain-containing protein [Blastocatellia bacterium]
MKHDISDSDWNDYLDGIADQSLRDRIEAHLSDCLSCWNDYEQLQWATNKLQLAGDEARFKLALDDDELHQIKQDLLRRLNSPNSKQAKNSIVRDQLKNLKTVLSPVCGSEAAARALSVAANQSPARSLESVTTENWQPFLERLTVIAAAMCGDTFAGLVRESGQI